MPEGDTIHRTAAALRTAVLGKPLTAFEAPRLTGLRPAIGAVIERVESKGKHLEIGFDDGVVLHTHMRMTGAWHLYRAGELWRKSTRHARVIIEVPGWQAVCFSAPVVRTYRAREFVPNPRLAELGPDLCRPDADIAECVARIDQFATPDTTVAEVLLDQRIACGVGNVYKSEVLWATEVHPFTPVGALLPEQREVLLVTAAKLLQANLDRPQRVTVPGVPGGVAVYGRHQKPCFRCGTPVEVAKHGEHARVTYWCPGCQLLLGLAVSDEPGDLDGDEPLAGHAARPLEDGWYEDEDDGDDDGHSWAAESDLQPGGGWLANEPEAERAAYLWAEPVGRVSPSTWIDGETAGLFDDRDGMVGLGGLDDRNDVAAQSALDRGRLVDPLIARTDDQ